MDSGCTNHMTGSKESFEEISAKDLPCTHITFGDKSRSEVLGQGKIAITHDLSLHNVFLVKALGYNLLSIAQLCDFGYACLFLSEEVIVTNRANNSLVFKGFREGEFYLVDFTKEESKLQTCLMAKASMSWLWHRRLAHVGMWQLDKLVKTELISGIKNLRFEKNKPCSACQARK